MSKINDITKKAALVAGMGLAAYGTAYAAEGADNGALTNHSIETNDNSHAKEVKKMIEEFKNQADIDFESKDGTNMNGKKLHEDEWKNRWSSIIERTFEDGSKETQFFSEGCNIIMKEGKFFTKNGEAIKVEDAMEKLNHFKYANRHAMDGREYDEWLKDQTQSKVSENTVFMKTLSDQKQSKR